MIYHFFGKTTFHKMNKKGMQFAPNFKYWHFGYFLTLELCRLQIFKLWQQTKTQCKLYNGLLGGGGKYKSSHIEGKSHMLPYLGNEFLLIAITKQDSFKQLAYIPKNKICPCLESFDKKDYYDP